MASVPSNINTADAHVVVKLTEHDGIDAGELLEDWDEDGADEQGSVACSGEEVDHGLSAGHGMGEFGLLNDVGPFLSHVLSGTNLLQGL